MSRRRKKRASGEEVELNLAAMLDMAFQLLTFFILTFKPAPVEGQVSLRLPPPQAVLSQDKNAKQEVGSSNDPVKGVTTLVISVFANNAGDAVAWGVGEQNVPSLAALDTRLQNLFSDPANPFEQVIVQVDPRLKYDQLMKVVEVCTRQTLPDKTRLSKLSFVEMPTGPGGNK